MAKAREGHGGTIAVPPPVPIELVRQRWDEVAELACVAAWQEACAAWWADRDDRRLRTASLDALLVDDVELARWLGRRLDTDTLIRAHGHVTAMRAGVERDLSRRTLVTGALRTHPVFTDHHDGTRRLFAAAEDVPRLLARAYADFQRVPDHAFIRAAWLSQMLGVIHPFRDANGGTARFLSSLELARSFLPPLILSAELRNGAYIEALAMARDLDPLALVMYEAVQQVLAKTLLSGRTTRAAWNEQSRARAAAWTRLVDERLRLAIGASVAIEREDTQADAAIARLVRFGYRMPAIPAPSVATWKIGSPVPLQVDLVIAPLRGGPTGWVVAAVVGSIGQRGELGAVLEREHVPMNLVAPDAEPDAIADARFRRWLDIRVEQTVRGLARWM